MTQDEAKRFARDRALPFDASHPMTLGRPTGIIGNPFYIYILAANTCYIQWYFRFIGYAYFFINFNFLKHIDPSYSYGKRLEKAEYIRQRGSRIRITSRLRSPSRSVASL